MSVCPINKIHFTRIFIMARTPTKTDNTPFIKIAGNFKKYSDLTQEGKNIVLDIISESAGEKKYPAKKAYYVLFNCTEISKQTVKYWLQRYYAENSNESAPTDSTVRKFLTITKKLSVALVDAHSRGVKLFKVAKDGMCYLSPVQKYTIDKMYNNGASAEELIIELQKIIDNNAN